VAISRHLSCSPTHALSGAYEFEASTRLADSHERWANFARDRASWLLAHKGKAMSAVELDGPPDRGDVILFGGRYWRVASTSRRTVNVVPSGAVANPTRVHYSDAPPLVDASVANRMAQTLDPRAVIPSARLAPPLDLRLATLQQRLWPVLETGGAPIVSTARGRKLLTFAGTRANLLMRASIRGGRYDEIGIELERDTPAVDVRDLVPDYELLVEGAHRRWQVFAASVTTTRWHELLPARLRRSEVLSQVIGKGVEEAIEAFRARRVVPIDDRFETSL